LYIKTFDTQNSPSEGLKLHYIVHTSLDVVEEKGNYNFLTQLYTLLSNQLLVSPTAKNTTDLYLGLLCPTEDYKVYV
jgi:hypothetical protein